MVWRDSEYIGKILKMELSGRRQRERPKGRFMDVVREDSQIVCLKEEDEAERERWRIDS